ncbi:MAG: hypothetical protein ACK4S6_05230 [Roseateles asaccharophilus]|uniref:Uncharacterized protein n=1 Tax=Roseateles asaccharophilus TaxID=582607 RepID=A0A4V3CJZ8_9BURK|nr:hypothetical protein [Roseateles asaccharophilus]MDN3543975.1 hypothetical protein [Roseateles asaccharophilus]TDP11646.1 hypothetical protein DFR39_10217 [Roseateles asaccharophilus]
MRVSPASALGPRALLMLAVLGLHLWLLGWLLHESRRPTQASPPRHLQAREPLSITLNLLPLPSKPKPLATPLAARPPGPARPAAPSSASARHDQAPSHVRPAEPRAQAMAPQTEVPPELPPMPASAPLPRLLDSEATRRAVRQAALEAPPGPLQAQAESSQQRLERGMKGSAHGDCLKGEFMGGGMGLLSAPFWLLAEARGKCGR